MTNSHFHHIQKCYQLNEIMAFLTCLEQECHQAQLSILPTVVWCENSDKNKIGTSLDLGRFNSSRSERSVWPARRRSALLPPFRGGLVLRSVPHGFQPCNQGSMQYIGKRMTALGSTNPPTDLGQSHKHHNLNV